MARTQPATSPQRNQNVEFLRILSAFGIVVFHGGGSFAEIGYAGLICFIILAAYFSFAAWDSKRGAIPLARDLLLPWAFFTILYALQNLLQHGWIFPPGTSAIRGLMYGTAPHLWFLPFIYAVLLAADYFKRIFKLQSMWLAALAGASLLLAFSPWWRDIHNLLDAPLLQWAHALPAAAIGAALGTAKAGDRLFITSTFVAIGGMLAFGMSVDGISIPYGIGIALTLAALWLPRITWNMEGASRCMLGVYLVHPAALSIFALFAARQSLLASALAFAASLSGVYIARRFFKASKHVLG